MGEFLQANWFWIVVLGLFIWMHRSGMGCGHGGHNGHDHETGHDRDEEDQPRRRDKVKGHQH